MNEHAKTKILHVLSNGGTCRISASQNELSLLISVSDYHDRRGQYVRSKVEILAFSDYAFLHTPNRLMWNFSKENEPLKFLAEFLDRFPSEQALFQFAHRHLFQTVEVST